MRTRTFRLSGRRWRQVLAALVAVVLAGGVVAAVSTDDGAGEAGVDAVSDDFAGEAAGARRASGPHPAPAAATAAAKGGSTGAATGAATGNAVTESYVEGDAGAGVAAPEVAADGRGGGLGGGLGAVTGHQQVIRTATLQLEVKGGGFRAAFDGATRVASDLGGFVAGSTTERRDEGASGSVTLRVPEARFDEARQRLARLGEVESEEVRGEDVGGQLVDLEARLRSLRAQEDVLRALVGRAKTVGEVIQVEQQLASVRQQIEQLAAEEARLKDSVTLSTITALIAEPGAAAPPEEPPGVLRRSLERAVDGALAVVGGTIVVIGYLVPIAVLLLVLFGLARLIFGEKLTGRRAGPVRDSVGDAGPA